RCIGIETDHRAVGTADVLGGANDHRAVNVALLHAAARSGFLDADDDDVADAGGTALRAAQHLDALDALGAAIVRNVQVGLHLDHGSTLILSNSTQASASATSSAFAFLPLPFEALAGSSVVSLLSAAGSARGATISGSSI